MVLFFVVKNNGMSTACNLYGDVLSCKEELYE